MIRCGRLKCSSNHAQFQEMDRQNAFLCFKNIFSGTSKCVRMGKRSTRSDSVLSLSVVADMDYNCNTLCSFCIVSTDWRHLTYFYCFTAITFVLKQLC
jgi:hypothetical protein